MKQSASDKRLRQLKAQNGLCALCGYDIEIPYKHRYLAPTWDHFWPIGKGGGQPNQRNRFVAHQICNSLKGDKSIDMLYEMAGFQYILYCFRTGQRISKKYARYYNRRGRFSIEDHPHYLNRQGLRYSEELAKLAKSYVWLLHKKG